jgi:hypothetical protein
MNEDAAHDCLFDLGKLGSIQFTDVSFDFLNECFVIMTLINDLG